MLEHKNQLTAQDLATWEYTCQMVREGAEIAAKRGMTPAQFRDLVHRACCEASFGGEKEGEIAC